MEWLADAWGLSTTQTLLVCAAILILIDIFFASEFPTQLAYVLVSVAIVIDLEMAPLLKVAVGIALWFALLGFHLAVWRGVVQRVANRVIAPDRYRSGLTALPGRTGAMCFLEGRWLVRVDGDLFPVEEDPSLGAQDGMRVRVVAVRDGRLHVERIGLD